MSFPSSSDGVEEQIVNALSCTMDEAMFMLSVRMEGPSTPRSKRRRRYVHHDREAAHMWLHTTNSTTIMCIPQHTSHEGTI
jgi:hypothetical protein